MLDRFAREQGITYDLLSDVGSDTIRHLGLLNSHLAEQQAFYGFEIEDKHRGLPYPGTIVLDGAGIVTERLFDQSYRERPSPGALLRAATGRSVRSGQGMKLSTSVVDLHAWFEVESFRPMERVDVTVRLDVAEGWHVYVPPVPRGFRALDVSVGPRDRVVQRSPKVPAGHPFSVEGIGEAFHVIEGSVEVVVPVLLLGAGFLPDGRKRPDAGPSGPLDAIIEVSFQACSDTECLPPETHSLEIRLEEHGQTVPGER